MVQCTREARLMDCDANNETECDHREDAGVICIGRKHVIQSRTAIQINAMCRSHKLH